MHQSGWTPEHLRAENEERGWVMFYEGPENQGTPVVEGQIVKPGSGSISVFRNYYGPILDKFCDENPSLRVLEIGSGLGHCTLGFIRTYSPVFYIATEPFTSLLPVIRHNLDSWGYPFPKGVAAAYDGNYRSILPSSSVNVVIGNSVLHLITGWRNLLSHAADVIDEKGIIIFGEPNHESWALIVSLIKALQLAKPLSGASQSRLSAFVKGLEYRFRHKDDAAALDRLEDKHIFSLLELSDFARTHELTFSVSKRQTNFQNTFCNKIAACLLSDNDRTLAREFATEAIGPYIDQTTLGDPFLVFSMTKA